MMKSRSKIKRKTAINCKSRNKDCLVKGASSTRRKGFSHAWVRYPHGVQGRLGLEPRRQRHHPNTANPFCISLPRSLFATINQKEVTRVIGRAAAAGSGSRVHCPNFRKPSGSPFARYPLQWFHTSIHISTAFVSKTHRWYELIVALSRTNRRKNKSVPDNASNWYAWDLNDAHGESRLEPRAIDSSSVFFARNLHLFSRQKCRDCENFPIESAVRRGAARRWIKRKSRVTDGI